MMISVNTEWPWLLFRDFTHPSLVVYQGNPNRDYWVQDPKDRAGGRWWPADWGFAFRDGEYGYTMEPKRR